MVSELEVQESTLIYLLIILSHAGFAAELD